MKKEAPLKCKGLRKNTSNEKIGTPKTQEEKKKDLHWKRGTLKTLGAKKKVL
jgi:hypothetical protein